MINRPYTADAQTFCEAIKALASNETALDNLDLYLSIHFAAWLEKYANTPENIAGELKHFSEME